MSPRLYCDHNATSPVPPEVRAAMIKALGEPLGNPSSVHAAGQRSAELLERARGEVAEAVAVDAAQVLFTSGGSESNALALAGVVHGSRRSAVAVSAVEHPSVLEAARVLCQRTERELRLLPVGRSGHVEVEAASRLIDDSVALVSVQYANHETGAVQPIAELGALARHHGCLFHVDAAQGLGRLKLDLAEFELDLMSLSGHKAGAPAGIGALVVRPGVPLQPLFYRGHQERGLRAGTPNLLGAVGLGAACKLLVPRSLTACARLRSLRDQLAQQLEARVPHTVVLTPRSPAVLAQTLCLAFEGAHAEAVVAELDQRGVAASAGAACRAGQSDPSSVLLAMGVAPELALCAVRFSLGPEHAVADIEQVIAATVEAVAAVRTHVGHEAGR
ncbi:MAG: cysteine desulfurase family protein [Pseudomonadota bacterium]